MKKIDTKFLARFHMIATGVWFCLIFPSIFLWKDSVAWVVMMSVWANFAAHFAAWQAAHSEVASEKKD